MWLRLPLAYLFTQLFETTGVEQRGKVTVIYEFPLKQTLTEGNTEQWREQYQSQLLLGWPNTPGTLLVCVSFVSLACMCVCVLGTSGGGGAEGRKIMWLFTMAEEKITF